jgi:hypothetical protein
LNLLSSADAAGPSCVPGGARVDRGRVGTRQPGDGLPPSGTLVPAAFPTLCARSSSMSSKAGLTSGWEGAEGETTLRSVERLRARPRRQQWARSARQGARAAVADTPGAPPCLVPGGDTLVDPGRCGMGALCTLPHWRLAGDESQASGEGGVSRVRRTSRFVGSANDRKNWGARFPQALGIAEKRGGARGPENVWGSAAAVRASSWFVVGLPLPPKT